MCRSDSALVTLFSGLEHAARSSAKKKSVVFITTKVMEESFKFNIDDSEAFAALDRLEKKLTDVGQTGQSTGEEITDAFTAAEKQIQEFDSAIAKAGKTTADNAKQVNTAREANESWLQSIRQTIAGQQIAGRTLGEWADQAKGFNARAGEMAQGVTKSAAAQGVLRVALTAVGASLAAGAGLLFAYFTRLQSGIDKGQQLVAGFRAGLGALLDRVGALGGALVKVFTGDFSGAAADAKAAITGIGSAILDAASSAFELEKRIQALRDLTITTSIELARQQTVLESLKTVYEDETQAIGKRIVVQREAAKIEVDIARRRFDLALEQQQIEQARFANSRKNAEDRQLFADAEVKLQEAQRDLNAAILNGEKEARELRKTAAEESRKASEARKKALEEERKILEGLAKDLQKLRLAALGEGLDADLLAVNQKFDELKKVAQNGVDELNKIEKRRTLTADELAQRKEFGDIQVRIEEQRITALVAVLQEYNEKDAALAKEQLERQKELSEKERKELEDRLKAQKELRDIGLQTAEAQADHFIFALEQQGASEKEIAKTKEQFDLEIQRARLQNELDFQTALLATLDAGDTERINRAKATITALKAQIGNITNELDNPDKEPFSIWKLLGIDDENAKEGIKAATQEIINSINQIAAARVEAAEAAIEVIDRQIAKQEEAINREAELAKAGLANDLSTEKERLAELKKQRDAAAKEEAKAKRAQIALDTVQQAVSLVTASANIFKSLSGLGPFGIPLAIGLIGVMFGAFIAARARALKSAEAPKFRKGTKLSGLSHEQGGIDMIDHRGEKVGEAEGDEWLIATAPSREHDRFLQRLNKGEFAGVDLNTAIPGPARYENRAGKAVERIREIERSKAELSDARHWAALKSAYSEGADRIVQAIKEQPEVLPILGGYKRISKKGNVTNIETFIPKN